MAPKRVKPPIGWREWIQIPSLGEHPIKAKIDTGARTSALHAFGLHVSGEPGAQVAHFELHPMQRSTEGSAEVSVPVYTHRRIRSSNGSDELRPVVRVDVKLGELVWPIELTLTSRDEMGFRMLLGRAAVRNRFLVDPGRSYLHGRPQRPQAGTTATNAAPKKKSSTHATTRS